MGSTTADGIRFQVYAQDHRPPHVHGHYGSTSVVVEIVDPEAIGLRPNFISPRNAKRRDLRRILDAAAERYDDLVQLWEEMHGPLER